MHVVRRAAIIEPQAIQIVVLRNVIDVHSCSRWNNHFVRMWLAIFGHHGYAKVQLRSALFRYLVAEEMDPSAKFMKMTRRLPSLE